MIEVDGKCTPTATEEELAKRRGRRAEKHEEDCKCGCQRHRGRQRRKSNKTKKKDPRKSKDQRRADKKKKKKSKNGKEITIVVIYTLKRGEDGRLHGPINKKVYATYKGRANAALQALAQAKKRGFDPNGEQEIQILMDGCKSLEDLFREFFPKARLTLDVRHVEQRLWDVARKLFREGSEQVEEWVEEQRERLYSGKEAEIIEELKKKKQEVPTRGPGTKEKREVLEETIGYIEPRLGMMGYEELLEKDLVIATGIVEGACRYVVGERMDCGGMRWVVPRAEMLLRLRCIELNGEWDAFFSWTQTQVQNQLRVCSINARQPAFGSVP